MIDNNRWRGIQYLSFSNRQAFPDALYGLWDHGWIFMCQTGRECL